MENENYQNEIMLDEIGYLAKLIDNEMTIFERMKVKKSTVYRIFGALMIYVVTMCFMSLIL